MRKLALIVSILSAQAFAQTDFSAQLSLKGMETRFEYIPENWGVIAGVGKQDALYLTCGIVNRKPIVNKIDLIAALQGDFYIHSKEIKPKFDAGVRFSLPGSNWFQLGTIIAREPNITPVVSTGFNL